MNADAEILQPPRHRLRRVCAVLLGLLLTVQPGLALPFVDVPEEGWAYAYIARTVEEGAASGVSPAHFSPDESVTLAAFVTMLTKAFYPSDIPAPSGGAWYEPYLEAARKNGLLEGLEAAPSDPLNRYEMAQLLALVLTEKGVPVPEDTERVLSGVADSAAIPRQYRAAAAAVYSAGIITGMNGGRFGGENTMTRAQTCVVYCKLSDLLRDLADGQALTVRGGAVRLGESLEQLQTVFGQAEETFPCLSGLTWHVYGASDYGTRFFMAGVRQGRVEALCSAGKAFSYQGRRAGDTLAALGYQREDLRDSAYGSWCENENTVLFFDVNDACRLHMVYLEMPGSALETDLSAEAVRGEERFCFHLTNAFRAWHSLDPLLWSEIAGQCARAHSRDMADKDYFDHYSKDDGSSPFERMVRIGISYRAAGENIARWSGSRLSGWSGDFRVKIGSAGGLNSYAMWVSSSTHRENLLSERYTYLGVGAACRAEEEGLNLYFTQNFYS